MSMDTTAIKDNTYSLHEINVHCKNNQALRVETSPSA